MFSFGYVRILYFSVLDTLPEEFSIAMETLSISFNLVVKGTTGSGPNAGKWIHRLSEA